MPIRNYLPGQFNLGSPFCPDRSGEGLLLTGVQIVCNTGNTVSTEARLVLYCFYCCFESADLTNLKINMKNYACSSNILFCDLIVRWLGMFHSQGKHIANNYFLMISCKFFFSNVVWRARLFEFDILLWSCVHFILSYFKELSNCECVLLETIYYLVKKQVPRKKTLVI